MKRLTISTAVPPNFQLGRGAHTDLSEGACTMELVSYLAGEAHTDRPLCACPVLSAFARSWNDSLSDSDRQRLLMPFVERLVGTRSTFEVEEQRAWMATDWLIRVHTPAFLELTPSLREHARVLSGLPPVLSRASACKAREEIDAARTAAGAAVGAAAWDAVWAAAGSAAGSAAWAAARSAAGAAAWAAARTAAGAAVGAAAWVAAWAAAGDELAPTVARLQESAVQLLSDMIEASGCDRARGGDVRDGAV